MTVLHFIRDHWIRLLAVWFIVATIVVAIFATIAIHGESDEQRDARRRAEAKRRADTALASFRRKKLLILAEREKANVSRQTNARIDAIVEDVISGADAQTRMREAEQYNATDYIDASDGRHVA